MAYEKVKMETEENIKRLGGNIRMSVLKAALCFVFWAFASFICWALVKGGSMNDFSEEDLSYEQDRTNES